jgi:hypothetical protein
VAALVNGLRSYTLARTLPTWMRLEAYRGLQTSHSHLSLTLHTVDVVRA